VFTPKDTETDWLLAKIYLKCADFQVHALKSHWLSTHLVMEPFAVSCIRNLPPCHPIYCLIWPHIRYVIAINVIGRDTLLNHGGVFDEILAVHTTEFIRKCYSDWTVEDLNFPETIKKRGVEDVPKYYYKEDGLVIWAAVEKFVGRIILEFYRTNGNVQQDTELQDWISDVATNGLRDHIYDKIDTIEQLVTLVTGIIWTCTAGHAAINTPQMDYMTFIPNYPASLRQVAPRKKGSQSFEIMAALPGKEITTTQIAAAFFLSQSSEQEIFISQLKPVLWVGEVAHSAHALFIDQLLQLKTVIERRNETNPLYGYLNPDEVPSTLSL